MAKVNGGAPAVGDLHALRAKLVAANEADLAAIDRVIQLQEFASRNENGPRWNAGQS